MSKLTDNEIVKALECCGKGVCKVECFGYFITGTNDCTTYLAKNTLDLINRLKADYEALKEQEEKAHQYCKNVCEPKYKAEIERLREIRDLCNTTILFRKIRK